MYKASIAASAGGNIFYMESHSLYDNRSNEADMIPSCSFPMVGDIAHFYEYARCKQKPKPGYYFELQKLAI
jgi:hypothetical protein